MSGKEKLIDYLIVNGKTNSWDELAKTFGFKNGERARGAWFKYRKNNPSENRAAQNVAEAANYISQLEDRVVKFEEDFKNNRAELVADTNKPVQSLEDLIRVCKIDTNKWEITKYTQSAAGNRYSIKAWLETKSRTGVENFSEQFTKFLGTYQPKILPRQPRNFSSSTSNRAACLIINKQDAHLNKYDINGDNDVEARFVQIENAVNNILKKASATSNLEEVIYILGSDQFNSEHTDMTTKGTPQKNAVNFHEGFEAICDHEIQMINLLLKNTKHLTVAFLAGNHDEFVGWHLVKWLEAYYRSEPRVEFQTGSEYRKYASYSNSAFMFNHGDALKPEKLAALFPMEYREEWSDHDHFYIFTGDKHNTLAKDINGIQFYQIPAVSKAKSSWDDKNGYTVTKAEMTAFLITEDDGMTDVYKEFLR